MTEEAGAVESPQTEQQNIAEASTEDLREMISTGQPEAEQPEQPETEPVAAEETEPAEMDPERQAKRRIRPKSALDQQVLDLYKSEAFDGTFADASRVIYGQEAQQHQNLQASPAEAKEPDWISQYDDRVTAIKGEITDLETKVDEAAENLETGEALKLQREITRRELEVQNLSGTKQRELERRREETYNTHRTKAMESRDRALTEYPALQDTESLPRKQFDEYVRVAQNNPDYASVFESPIWPEIMVREFAAAHAQPEPQAPPQTNPVMGNQAQVLTTGTAAQPANAPVTAAQVASNMGQMSNDQLYALLGQDDGRRTPLR